MIENLFLKFNYKAYHLLLLRCKTIEVLGYTIEQILEKFNIIFMNSLECNYFIYLFLPYMSLYHICFPQSETCLHVFFLAIHMYVLKRIQIQIAPQKYYK